jgi:hypothetical protein
VKILLLILAFVVQAGSPPFKDYPPDVEGTRGATPQPACEEPDDLPSITFLVPSTGALPGTDITASTTVSDPTSAIDYVAFWYMICPETANPAFACGDEIYIGKDETGPGPYTQLWTFPTCGEAPDNQKFTIIGRVYDVCGNMRKSFVDDLALNGRGC